MTSELEHLKALRAKLVAQFAIIQTEHAQALQRFDELIAMEEQR